MDAFGLVPIVIVPFGIIALGYRLKGLDTRIVERIPKLVGEAFDARVPRGKVKFHRVLSALLCPESIDHKRRGMDYRPFFPDREGKEGRTIASKGGKEFPSCAVKVLFFQIPSGVDGYIPLCFQIDVLWKIVWCGCCLDGKHDAGCLAVVEAD